MSSTAGCLPQVPTEKHPFNLQNLLVSYTESGHSLPPASNPREMSILTGVHFSLGSPASPERCAYVYTNSRSKK